jgi:lipopolysaccharide transport system permease protein
VLSGLVDFAISAVLLAILMVFYRVTPTLAVLLLPAFLLLAILTALGFGLWLSALNVRYRDVKHLMPFIVQIWMYLTPVVYSASLIPERYRWLLSLNPMTAVVAGFRWALLGGPLYTSAQSGALFLVSVMITFIVLFSGAVFFRRTERTFADII